MSRRRTTRIGAVALSATMLAGCGFEGAASIPLPGGEGTGDDAYKLVVEFADVLDLVPQSAVKVDEVTVGSVEEIDLDGFTARVRISLNPEVELPANVNASLRQTSLLGEKFVSLDRPPASESSGRLRGGETIGLDQTSRSAEIEEVLGAFSLLLNGGSLEQLQVINTEVTNVFEGRETDIKDLLGQLDVFVGGLDDQKAQIVRALDSLDRLNLRLVGERDTLAVALDDIPDGLAVLTRQREQITELLTSLDELGDVAVRVIDGSKDNTVASLAALRPILTELNAAGQDLPNAFELLTNYPFPRSIEQGIKGDYANLFVTLDLDIGKILAAEGIPAPIIDVVEDVEEVVPELPELPEVPELPGPLDLPLQEPLAPLTPLTPDGVPSVPPLDQVVPAPGGDGLISRLNPLRSSNGDGLLGLLIGGLR